MIQTDQPTCFPDGVIVSVSSREDGTMLDRLRDFHASDVKEHRAAFCMHARLSYDQCAYQLIEYGEKQTFDTIAAVTVQDTTKYKQAIPGDGLFTSERGVGLFLPVADCVATVMYDQAQNYLGLLHLGRHATYADLATCAVKYFTERDSNVEDIIIWMGPHAGKDAYRLEWFDREHEPAWQGFYTKKIDGYYLDLAGYNRQRFIAAGILSENIYVSSVDTVTDTNYFSHLDGDVNERIAVVAMMK